VVSSDDAGSGGDCEAVVVLEMTVLDDGGRSDDGGRGDDGCGSNGQ